MGGADLRVDVGAVGRDADGDHLGPQLVEGGGRYLVGGPVGAIDDHAQAVQRGRAREGGLGDLHVAGLGVVDALDAAQGLGLGQALLQPLLHQRLDLQLAVVGELVAVRPEQLDAVVAEAVVAGGDHHPQVCAHGSGHQRHGRRGQGAEQPHVHARGGEAGHQRGLQHVAGQPRVLADHHQVAAGGVAQEQLARGQAHPQGDLRRHGVLVRLPADAVGAEELACGHGRTGAPKPPGAGDACASSPKALRTRSPPRAPVGDAGQGAAIRRGAPCAVGDGCRP